MSPVGLRRLPCASIDSALRMERCSSWAIGPGSRPRWFTRLTRRRWKSSRACAHAAVEVEGPHVLGVQALVVRVVGRQGRELGEHLAVHAEPQLGVDEVLQDDQPGLLELLAPSFEDPAGDDVDERGSAPQLQRAGEGGQRGAVVPRRQRPASVRDELMEPVDVQIPLGGPEEIAAGPGHEDLGGDLTGGHSRRGRQQLAQVEDVGLQRGQAADRRLLVPEFAYQ